MADPRIVTTAFKEWAAVIRTLEQGDQICLVRKGTEEDPRFELDVRRFWLLPTYELQTEDMIQPRYHPYLEETETEREDLQPGQIRLQSWAEAKYRLQIRKAERLNWLTNYTAYSPQCLQEVFQFQPGEILYVLVVRVFNLPDPRILRAPREERTVPVSEEELEESIAERNRRGNKTHTIPHWQDREEWAEIQQRIPLQADQPAVTDAEFEERKRELRERFVRPEDEKPEPWLF